MSNNDNKFLLWDKEEDNHDDGWKTEWKNMPEFVQEKKPAFRKIVIRLRDQQDLDDLQEKLGQKISDKAKSVWYPELERGQCADKVWDYDESEDTVDAQ